MVTRAWPFRAATAALLLAVLPETARAEDRAATTRAAAGVAVSARPENGPRGSAADLADLDRAYAAGLGADLAGEFQEANRIFRSVIEGLDRLPDAPDVFAAWTRATVRLARSEQQLGHDAEAQALLERVLRVVPDLRVEPRQYPPSFLALVEQGRARLKALGTRRLAVETDPEARVFVEGREVGAGPVAALALPPGRYRVSVERAGQRALPVAVDLLEDQTVRLGVTGAAPANPAALAVGPQAAERILAAPPAPAGPPRPSRVPGWAAVGTGALAVGLGVATVVLARDAQASYDRARAMGDGRGGLTAPHTALDYNAMLGKGDAQRRDAINVGVAAGVSAATSAVLGYWSWRKTGEIGPFRF